MVGGFIQHPTFPWSTSLVCVPNISGGIRISASYQQLNKVTDMPQNAILRDDEVFDTLGGGSGFSEFTQLTIHPDTISLTAFCTLSELYEWLRMP